ncbi:hypothetical protein VTN49DRAFT_7768 [Thermomyces lanuginosus]|uniref:uncharacterized protein n=1 Tax=Thermomyces lanuginosus TaxID=5541 RepID=UPI0037436171
MQISHQETAFGLQRLLHAYLVMSYGSVESSYYNLQLADKIQPGTHHHYCHDQNHNPGIKENQQGRILSTPVAQREVYICEKLKHYILSN